jgi:predicted dehydrogenase
MKKRMALIGLGIMGRRMLASVIEHPDFAVCGAWDPAPASIARAREIFPELPVSANATAAIADCDFVYLACPPVPRKALALAAIAAGKPVFMEKPLGTDEAASREILQALERASMTGVVNFTQASSRSFEELRRAINSGETGEILGIDIVVNYPAWPRAWQVDADWLRFRAEGGYTREVISHFLFLALRFLGPLKLLEASPRYPADPLLCELDLLARLEAKDGRPVTVMATTGGKRPDRQEVTVRGDKMSYQFREFHQLWRSDGGPWVEAIDWSGAQDPRRDGLRRQLDEVQRWLRGESHKLATAEESFAVQQLVEAMLKGAHS